MQMTFKIDTVLHYAYAERRKRQTQKENQTKERNHEWIKYHERANEWEKQPLIKRLLRSAKKPTPPNTGGPMGFSIDCYHEHMLDHTKELHQDVVNLIENLEASRQDGVEHVVLNEKWTNRLGIQPKVGEPS